MISPSALGTNCRILTDGNLPITPSTQAPALIIYLTDINGANSRPTLNTPPLNNIEPYLDLALSKLEAWQDSVIGTSDETNANMVLADRRYGTSQRQNNTVNNTNYRNTESVNITFYYGNTASNDPDALT